MSALYFEEIKVGAADFVNNIRTGSFRRRGDSVFICAEREPDIAPCFFSQGRWDIAGMTSFRGVWHSGSSELRILTTHCLSCLV